MYLAIESASSGVVNSNTILITSITFDVSLESDQSPAPEQYDINENENQDDDSIIYLA